MVVQKRQRNIQKRWDARAKLLFCLLNLLFFLFFEVLVAILSSDLKVPNDRYFETMVNFRDPPTSPGWRLTTSVLSSSIFESPIIHSVCPQNFVNKIVRTMDNFFNFQWSRDSGIVKNTNHLHLWKHLKEIYRRILILALFHTVIYPDAYTFLSFEIA